MSSTTKQRMVEAAAMSLRQRGLSATSFTDVLAASGAARGAIYHHFPTGKNGLAEQAVEWEGQRIKTELLDLRGDHPTDVISGYMDLLGPVVALAAQGTSCAVAAATVESSPEHSTLNAIAGAAFQSWIDALDMRLQDAGLEPVRARSVAQLLVTFSEGSMIVARACGDTRIFEQSASTMQQALGQSILD